MKSGVVTLLACCLVTFVLGSIHAYSVFLVSLENQYETTRDAASLGYSIGLACLTLAVLFGHRIYGSIGPALLVVLICITATIGAYIAGNAADLVTFIMGYGIIFGTANGLGYGFCLQLSAKNLEGKSGLAMGLVTAAYAAGATVYPYIFTSAITSGGLSNALDYLIGSLLLTAIGAGLLLRIAKSNYRQGGSSTEVRSQSRDTALQVALWLGYGTAAGAGLMVIAHAHPIFVWMGESAANALLATTIFAVGNLVGGVLSGWLCDRFDIKTMLIALPILSVIAFSSFQVSLPLTISLVAMGLVGFSYGALIVCYPVAVNRLFGPTDSPRIYGRVFTAWGLTGLFGPWLAGALYEMSGGYSTTLVLAALMGMLSALVVVSKLHPIPPLGKS